jgi:hypothetical protein
VFRAKNALGKITGGTDATSAQNTGPAITTPTPDSVLTTLTTINPSIAPSIETVTTTVPATISQSDTANVF